MCEFDDGDQRLFTADLNIYLRIKVIEEEDGTRYLTMAHLNCWDCRCMDDSWCTERGAKWSVSTALALMDAIRKGVGLGEQIIRVSEEEEIRLDGCVKAVGISCHGRRGKEVDIFLSPSDLRYFKRCFKQIKRCLISQTIENKIDC